jgi:hypothetical protein
VTLGSTSLKRTLRRYRLGYILSAILCLIGLISLSIVILKSWPQMGSSSDFFSAFWVSLWEENLSLIPGLEFRLAYFLILSVATFVSAVAVFMFSRQSFLLPGKAFRLQCPFCKKFWRASYDRGQVLCPHCHHLVHPRMTEQ